MARSRPLLALAVIIAVVVVGTAAAALDGTGSRGSGSSNPSASGIGSGNGSGVGAGNGSGFALSDDEIEPGEPTILAALFRRLVSLIMLFAVVGPVVYVALVLWKEGVRALVETLKEVLADLLAVLALFAVILLIVYLLSLLSGDGGGGLMGEGTDVGGFDSASGDAERLTPVDVPVPLLVVGAVLAVAFLGAALTGRSLPGLSPSRTGPDRPRAPGTAEGGDGRRRIETAYEDVPASNDVYRAWRRLAEVADATDRTVTPTEVAAAARERGLDAGAVDEVTQLFHEVRYEGRTPTPERERRARTALDRLRDDE